MTEKRQGRRLLRRVVPLAAAGCAALAATLAVGRRRSGRRSWSALDPPDSALADDEMEALATGEGMPEAREA